MAFWVLLFGQVIYPQFGINSELLKEWSWMEYAYGLCFDHYRGRRCP